MMTFFKILCVFRSYNILIRTTTPQHMKQIHISGTSTSNKGRQADKQSCSSNVPCRDVIESYKRIRIYRQTDVCGQTLLF